MRAVLLLLLGALCGAHASHFRFGTISWTYVSTRRATFKLDQAWRRDFSSFRSDCGPWYGSDDCEVGDEIQPGTMKFPSGSPSSRGVDLKITAISKSENWMVGTWSYTVSYSGNGPYQVSMYTCCRLGGIRNSPAELATTSTVRFGRINSSPVTNAPPIIRFQQNRINKFSIPVSDPDLDLVKFSRYSIGSSAGNINSLTVNPESGLLTWNPASSPRGYYTVVVKMYDYDKRYCSPPVTACSSAHILSDVMVDFFVEVIANDGTKAPEFVSPTPADGSTISVNAGQQVSLDIKAVDPDGDRFDLQPSWAISGMSFAQSSGTGTVNTKLNWRVPNSPQQINQACFFARDSRKVESPLHCITLKVGQITVTSVEPLARPNGGFVYSGETVKVSGENMAGGSSYKCRFRSTSGGSAVEVAATSKGLREMNCPAPNYNSNPGTYTVEVTKDGSGFTTDGRTIEIRASCPPSITNLCSGHGTCDNGVCRCTPPFSGAGCESECGNGKVEQGEQCDDGNTAAGDGCSATCRIESGCSCSGLPSTCQCCGNSNREGTETCDDGNTSAGDGCDARCATEPGFTCSSASPSVCQRCGNGKREGTETCDDGNTSAGDGCDATCKTEGGWTCSNGVPNVCEKCGNGVREGGETCDDGNTAANDGCDATCKVESGWTCNPPVVGSGPEVCQKCGNGAKEGTEECDDGNASAGDGCSATCKVETGWSCPTPGQPCVNTPELCGNGKLDGSETCDDGNKASGDGCSFGECQTEAGWTCEGAPSNCFKCGNGVVETDGTAEETCDDGNAAAGDGCSATCKIETGFTCDTAQVPSVCQNCGDGVVQGTETCDDGNTAGGDGCSATCGIEDGYFCDTTTVPSVCTACPNGKVEANAPLPEQCDDNNAADGDGCSRSCQIEHDWECNPDPDTGVSVCTPIVRPPLTPGTVDDGGDFVTTPDRLSATWSGFTDPVTYSYKVGTVFNGSDISTWTVTGKEAKMSLTGLSLVQGATYYITVRSENSFKEFSWGYGDGVVFDGTAPISGAIVDGAAEDTGFTKVTTSADLFFTEFRDPESGVDPNVEAIVGFGSAPGSDDLSAFAPLAPGVSSSRVELQGQSELRDNGTYYWTVRVPNTAGLLAQGSSNGFTVDLRPPSSEGVIVDDRIFQGTANEVRASWSVQFTDASSGIDRVEWCLGLAEDGAPADGVFKWSNIGTQQEVFVSNEEPFLEDKKRYRITVRAFDGVGFTTDVVSDGFTVDLSPPAASPVVAGPTAGTPVVEVSQTNEFTLSWTDFDDAESGIDHYEVALGTKDNITDIANFTSAGTRTTFIISDLDLTPFAESDTPVYGILRGYNGAGSYNETNTGAVRIVAAPGGSDRDSAKDDESFLTSTTGKSLLGAGVATAAVLGAGVAGFLGLKSMRKRRLAARTEAARVAKREQMKRSSSLAADSNEFSVDVGDEMGDMGDNGPVEEVESAGYH